MAVRLCSRCFYWKYQEEGQGRAVFLFQPGLEEGGGAERLHGWDNRQCSGQRSSFHRGRPRREGLRLAVEVGTVWGVWCVPLGVGSRGEEKGCHPLLPLLPLPYLSSCLRRRTGVLRERRGRGAGKAWRRRQRREVQATAEAEGVEEMWQERAASHCTLLPESALSWPAGAAWHCGTSCKPGVR